MSSVEVGGADVGVRTHHSQVLLSGHRATLVPWASVSLLVKFRIVPLKWGIMTVGICPSYNIRIVVGKA